MGKVYYTKDVSKVRGLYPLLKDVNSLAEIGKYVGRVIPTRLEGQNTVQVEDVVLLAIVANGRTVWSAYTTN